MLHKLDSNINAAINVFYKLSFNIQVMYNKLATVFDASDKVVYVNDDNTCIVARNGINPVWVYCNDYRELDEVAKLVAEFFKQTPEHISIVTDNITIKYIKYSFAELSDDLSLIACKKDWLIPYYCTSINKKYNKYNTDCIVKKFEDNNFGKYRDDICLMQKEFFINIGKEKSDAEIESRVNNLLDDKSKLYLLLNKDSEALSMCITRKHFNMTGLCGVCTLDKYKGNHYSTDLVAEVTKSIIDNGDLPVLYAQTENKISNRMYQNIGYMKAWELVQYINENGGFYARREW